MCYSAVGYIIELKIIQYWRLRVSDQQESKKTAAQPAHQAASTGKTKSLDELLHGFEEIRKIHTNQELFQKGGSKPNFEKIKKTVSDHDNSDQ